jgi:hypothetical protein
MRDAPAVFRPSKRAAAVIAPSAAYRGHSRALAGKAWVRFDDSTNAIVGGSRVER